MRCDEEPFAQIHDLTNEKVSKLFATPSMPRSTIAIKSGTIGSNKIRFNLACILFTNIQ